MAGTRVRLGLNRRELGGEASVPLSAPLGVIGAPDTHWQCPGHIRVSPGLRFIDGGELLGDHEMLAHTT